MKPGGVDGPDVDLSCERTPAELPQLTPTESTGARRVAGKLASPMPEIRPFRGLRFGSSEGELSKLVAPPYDVLSPAERDRYAAQHKHNIVHLTLPEHEADDRSKFVKYARSAALLAEWRREEVLKPEAKPAFYRYSQSFKVDGSEQPLLRTCLIALIKIEPYEKGVVLPHEETFPKHKEDRLRLLEATRSHLECIFGLFEDPDSLILKTIHEAPADGACEVKEAIGSSHYLEPITDEKSIGMLSSLLADKKVWIADGHHRYETALSFREAVGSRADRVAEDYMMMALASMSDPGLVLLPTHRIVHSLPYDADEMLGRIGEQFHLEETHASRLMNEIEASHKAGKRAFGIATQGGHGYVATPKDEALVGQLLGDSGSKERESLDVTILHHLILERLLGHKGVDGIEYTRNPREAEHAVDQGAAVAFLMNPPTVDDMRTIALGGEKMPQKSTYYFPKILSGLVLWSLSDFD